MQNGKEEMCRETVYKSPGLADLLSAHCLDLRWPQDMLRQLIVTTLMAKGRDRENTGEEKVSREGH